MTLDEEVDLFVKGLGKVPDQAVKTFKVLCQRTCLSPVARQIYLIERGGKWQAQTSIDGFRAIADRNPKYQGQDGPYWAMSPEGPWTDIPPDETPYAAKVGVFKEGAPKATFATAKYSDYAAGPMWKKFPTTMIAKCAEALALRKAFPADMAGLYTAEEMDQADKPKVKRAGPGGGGAALKSLEPEGEHESAVERSTYDFTAAVKTAPTIDALKSMKETLMRLSKDEQAELSPVYAARMRELKEASGV